jgi:hypothetical protein
MPLMKSIAALFVGLVCATCTTSPLSAIPATAGSETLGGLMRERFLDSPNDVGGLPTSCDVRAPILPLDPHAATRKELSRLAA